MTFSGQDGLALAGNAPKIFRYTLPNGLPVAAVLFSSLFALLSYMGIKQGSGKVFGWLANLTAIAGLVTWFGICVTYIRFYKGMQAQGIDRSKLPYYSKFQPYAAWYALFIIVFIALVSSYLWHGWV